MTCANNPLHLPYRLYERRATIVYDGEIVVFYMQKLTLC